VITTLDSWISGGTRRAISGSSHKLFVRQDGPIVGKPVTLLHGFPASSFDWTGVMPNLTGTGHRVTTLDFLGYGSSDKPYPYRYSLMEQASLVEAVWRDLGIDQTALVAHDYGVSVAQELLSRDPGRIESMAWLNGGMFPDLHRPADFQRHLAELDGDAAETYITETLYRKALLGVFGRPVPDHTLGEMWADFSKSGGARVAPALLGYMAERREHAARWSHAVESYSVHKLSSGVLPTRLVDPMSSLVFTTRLRSPASSCWTTRHRSDTFLRSRRPSSLDLCSLST
jgi:pimeloyl-ACP methyl ester carboxylesterase